MWKPIPSYPGYEVSDKGQVRSWHPAGWGKRQKLPLLLRLTNHSGGYKLAKLYRSKRDYLFGVHRLVALAFLPNPENKREVSHLNGNPADNRVSNLAWATRRENQLLMQKHGTQYVNCKLTADDVRYIRRAISLAPPRSNIRHRLAKQFKVGYNYITKIHNREIWKVYWE